MKAAFHFGAGLVNATAISEIRLRAVIRSECRAVARNLGGTAEYYAPSYFMGRGYFL